MLEDNFFYQIPESDRVTYMLPSDNAEQGWEYTVRESTLDDSAKPNIKFSINISYVQCQHFFFIYIYKYMFICLLSVWQTWSGSHQLVALSQHEDRKQGETARFSVWRQITAPTSTHNVTNILYFVCLSIQTEKSKTGWCVRESRKKSTSTQLPIKWHVSFCTN